MKRRDFIRFAALATGFTAWPRPSLSAIDAPGLKEGEVFSPDGLRDYARTLSKSAYQAPDASLPGSLQNLDYNHYIGIRFHQDRAIWSAESRGFVIEPLHRGFIYAMPVDLFTIEDGRVLIVPYDAGMFDFGGLQPPAVDTRFGFSGFRLKAPLFSPDRVDDFAIFQGASYFRAIAKGQNYGTLARGLAVNTGDAAGEQFPIFRAFWIERPPVGSKKLVVHALLDSDAATGAFKLTLQPGDMTFVDVECTIFPRSRIEHVGIAPMNSMYLFGDNDHRGVDDVRVAVHESSGLQMWNGAGEWIWRPLQNPETLQISSFIDTNPKGFGLLQRNRDATAFEDSQHGYEREPSVWVAPVGNWGEGAIQLVEIPSDAEIHDNIIAYWRPKDALEPGHDYAFAYRSAWCSTPPDQPTVAVVKGTRIGDGGDRRRRFVIDFAGDIFADVEKIKGVGPNIAVNPGKISDIAFTLDTSRRIGRLSFVLDPQNETYSEMRALLTQDGKPISETWLYRWTP